MTPVSVDQRPRSEDAFAEGLDGATLARADEVLDRLMTTREGTADPYPLYRELREIAPLYRSGWDGLWYASRYDDCKAILLDPLAGRPPAGMRQRHGMNPVFAERFRRQMRHNMLTANPPEHTRLRAPVSRTFTPRRMAALESSITARIDAICDQMADAGEVDLMAVMAFALPVAVIGDLVGVPLDDRERFRVLSRVTQAAAEPDATPEMQAEAERAMDAQEAFFVDLVAQKRAHPGDDLLSDLVAQRDAGGPLSEAEMVSTARLLFGAGFVTTTNLIGNAMVTLFRHPDQMRRLWDDPSLATTAVEEVLRYESIVQSNGREVLETTELGVELLLPGDFVVTLIGGANRDPARFTDPERFDIGRTEEVPLSFGWGVHHCLGAPLARLEGKLVLTRFAERFASMELAGPEPPWSRSFLRGVGNLPVRVVPR
ncbi:MAG TPA: cytochrome P450 [Acidimicrobiia bacterium]